MLDEAPPGSGPGGRGAEHGGRARRGGGGCRVELRLEVVVVAAAAEAAVAADDGRDHLSLDGDADFPVSSSLPPVPLPRPLRRRGQVRDVHYQHGVLLRGRGDESPVQSQGGDQLAVADVWLADDEVLFFIALLFLFFAFLVLFFSLSPLRWEGSSTLL